MCGDIEQYINTIKGDKTMKKYHVTVSYEVKVEAENKQKAEEVANAKIYDGDIDPDVLVTEED